MVVYFTVRFSSLHGIWFACGIKRSLWPYSPTLMQSLWKVSKIDRLTCHSKKSQAFAIKISAHKVWWKSSADKRFRIAYFGVEIGSGLSSAIRAIYQNTNDKIAKLSKIFDEIINRLIFPLFIIAPIVLSIVRYVLSDYSNESFQQIYPST